MVTEKYCAQCDQVLPAEAFRPVSYNRDGLYSWCVPCKKTYDREGRIRRGKEHRNKTERDRWAKMTSEEKYKAGRRRIYKYGVTHEQFEEMMSAQDGVCAICGNFDNHVGKSRLSIDHDHQTGAVRGLLCHRCNVAIGLLREDVNIMENAIAYIQTAELFGRSG